MNASRWSSCLLINDDGCVRIEPVDRNRDGRSVAYDVRARPAYGNNGITERLVDLHSNPGDGDDFVRLAAMCRQAPRDGPVRKVNDNATAAGVSPDGRLDGAGSGDAHRLVRQNVVESGTQPATKMPRVVLLELRAGIERDIRAPSQSVPVGAAGRPFGCARR